MEESLDLLSEEKIKWIKKRARAIDSYRPEYADMMRERANEGSAEYVASKLGISRSYFYAYQELYPDFKEACKRERPKSLWEYYYKNRGIKK